MIPGAPYSWIDASGGTELILDDDEFAALPLPFDFNFYDRSFTTVYVCSNGFLSFKGLSPDWNNIPFPSGHLAHHYIVL